MTDDFARKPARLESGRAAARNVDLGYGGFQSAYGKGRLGTSEMPRREAGSALLPGSVRNESRPHQQLSGNKSKSQPKSGRKDQPNFNAMAEEVRAPTCANRSSKSSITRRDTQDGRGETRDAALFIKDDLDEVRQTLFLDKRSVSPRQEKENVVG